MVITDRGRPSHILLSIEQYDRLVGDRRNIVDRLSAADDLDLGAERLTLTSRVPDL